MSKHLSGPVAFIPPGCCPKPEECYGTDDKGGCKHACYTPEEWAILRRIAARPNPLHPKGTEIG